MAYTKKVYCYLISRIDPILCFVLSNEVKFVFNHQWAEMIRQYTHFIW